jgi:hypothetical protein
MAEVKCTRIERGTGRIGCAAKEKSSDAGAVENQRERTTTGVVGRPRLHNHSREFCREEPQLTERTGENRA